MKRLGLALLALMAFAVPASAQVTSTIVMKADTIWQVGLSGPGHVHHVADSSAVINVSQVGRMALGINVANPSGVTDTVAVFAVTVQWLDCPTCTDSLGAHVWTPDCFTPTGTATDTTLHNRGKSGVTAAAANTQGGREIPIYVYPAHSAADYGNPASTTYQLTDACGIPFTATFAKFKWRLIAGASRVQYSIAFVGAGR